MFIKQAETDEEKIPHEVVLAILEEEKGWVNKFKFGVEWYDYLICLIWWILR
jgi:hypothetical protein